MRPHYFDFDRYLPRGPYWRQLETTLCAVVAALAREAAAEIRQWPKRLRARHELAELDHRLLRDIGVTPSEVARECAKPFWRA